MQSNYVHSNLLGGAQNGLKRRTNSRVSKGNTKSLHIVEMSEEDEQVSNYNK